MKQLENPNLNIPTHIAVIMDGNGRWAAARGLPRTMGHQRGSEAVKRITHAAAELGVKYLTLFGFSSENWSRPESEVKELMKLLRSYLRSETAELHKNGIRLRVIGNRRDFDQDIIDLIDNAERLTADNRKITLVMALNYGGRNDILHAANALADYAAREKRKLSEEEVEALFPQFLMTSGIPDPDLMIRTSGEQRISNFLLWPCAYTEFVFTNTLWPDFDKQSLEQAIEEYNRRDRRFGNIASTKR
ncbi:MAG: isoprenyl transferase [Alphaproteobacteria bacterium]|nr:isoprenyl transferase [Alphaproteobacteria bacterium]